MRGKAWALTPLLKYKGNAEFVTLHQFSDRLISHHHLKNSLQSPAKIPDRLAVYNEYENRVLFGAEVGIDDSVFFWIARFKSPLIRIGVGCHCRTPVASPQITRGAAASPSFKIFSTPLT